MRRFAVAMILLEAGCVDLGVSYGRTLAPTFAHESARRAAEEQARAAARVSLSGDYTNVALRVAVEGPVTHWFSARLRVDSQDANSWAASDVPPSPWRGAVKTDGGWVFTTRDAVYFSETFTGPLRLLHVFSHAAREPLNSNDHADTSLVLHTSRHLAAVTVNESESFVVERNALRALNLPPVVSLAFGSPMRGAAVLSTLRLRTTRDGGRTWREVDTGRDIPLRVEASNDGLVLVTTNGARAIGDDDVLEARPTNPEASDGDAQYFTRCTRSVSEIPAASALLARRFDLAPGAPPSGPHGADRPAPSDFGLQLDPPVALDGDAASRRDVLDRLDDRVFGDNHTAAAVASVRMLSRLRTGRRAAIAWRSIDALGPYRRRVAIDLTGGIAIEEWSQIAGATRGGLLIEANLSETRSSGVVPLWVSSQGAHPLWIGRGVAAEVDGVVPLDHGGAWVLLRARSFDERCDRAFNTREVQIVTAIELGPDGAERRRMHASAQPARRELLGLARVGDVWGFAFLSVTDPNAVTLVRPDGSESALARWTPGTMLTICSDTRGDTEEFYLDRHDVDRRSHIRPLPIAVHVRDQTLRTMEPRLIRLERSAQTRCVRSVSASARGASLYRVDESGGMMWNSLRVSARGGALVGQYDDGERITPVRFVAVSGPQLPESPAER